MEKKVKYNLISSIFFIFAGLVAIYPQCLGNYKYYYYVGTSGMITFFWGISYIVSGMLGLLNLEGDNRKLVKASAIVMIVLSSLQAFIYFIVVVALRYFVSNISIFLLALLISTLGLLYAIGLLVDKKVFSIVSFSITCLILFVCSPLIISGGLGEWILLIFSLLPPAFLFNAKAIANKKTNNNF